MKKPISLLIGLCFCILGMGNLFAQNDPNARDILILVDWFEGEFDNDSQIWFEGRMGIAEDAPERHGQMHTTHTRIKNSSLGEHVFYVEEYIDNDTTKISRQRIVSFKSLAPKSGIEMAIHFLRDSKKYIGSHRTPDLLQKLTEEDLFGLDGCNVIFQRIGEQYEGHMKEKACQFGEGDLKRYSVHDMIISKNQYWRVDRSFLVKNDAFHAGHPTDEPHKMRKATTYSCDVNFYEKSYAEPHENDIAYKNLRVHSQGGFAWVTYPKNGKRYGVQLREKEYPFYDNGSDFFMLRFIEEGAKRSTILVTAEPGIKKISFNNGWASCACKKISN